jgi:hypothetical protein
MKRKIPKARNEVGSERSELPAAIHTNEFSFDDFLGRVVLGRKRDKSKATFAL